MKTTIVWSHDIKENIERDQYLLKLIEHKKRILSFQKETRMKRLKKESEVNHKVKIDLLRKSL